MYTCLMKPVSHQPSMVMGLNASRGILVKFWLGAVFGHVEPKRRVQGAEGAV